MASQDLTAFHDPLLEGVPWEKRAHIVLDQFGSVNRLQWRKAFDSDIDLFGRLVRDILKLDQAQPGRPGPRPALDYDQGVSRLRQYLGTDYSIVPFPETLRDLAGGRSVRSLAHKVGLSKTYVHGLMTGAIPPDAYAMTQIAKAFEKHPSFFSEWRSMWIAGAIAARLQVQPESSIALYRKFKDN